MYNWVRIQLYILHYSIQHYTLHTIHKHKKKARGSLRRPFTANQKNILIMKQSIL